MKKHCKDRQCKQSEQFIKSYSMMADLVSVQALAMLSAPPFPQ